MMADHLTAEFLTKIERIITLQERATNQAEAEAAAAALQRLLTRHNIEMTELAGRLGKPKQTVSLVRFPERAASWRRLLWAVVADANQAKVIIATNGEIMLFAHEGKHDLIRRTVEGLSATALRIAPAAYEAYVAVLRDQRRQPLPQRTWSTSFRLGFTSGVKQALADAAQAAAGEYTGSSALVLVNQKQEVETFVSGQGLRIQSYSAFANTDAYETGRAAGYAHGHGRAELSR